MHNKVHTPFSLFFFVFILTDIEYKNANTKFSFLVFFPKKVYSITKNSREKKNRKEKQQKKKVENKKVQYQATTVTTQ